MKKHIIILLLIVSIFSVIINIYLFFMYNCNITKVSDGSLENYKVMLDGYIPDGGYVPDAKTAVIIARAVIEATFEKKGGSYDVEYDQNEEVWIVQNYYLLGNPKYVIIKQSDGSIISAWGTK